MDGLYAFLLLLLLLLLLFICFIWKIQQNLAEQQIKLVGEESNQICTHTHKHKHNLTRTAVLCVIFSP